LTEPEVEGDEYTIAYKVDNAGKETLVQLAREQGDPSHFCQTCTGGGGLKTGFRAEVTGIITDTNRSPPTLEILAAIPSNGREDQACLVPSEGPSTTPTLAPDVPTGAPVTLAPVSAMGGSTDSPVVVVDSNGGSPTMTPVLLPAAGATKEPTPMPVLDVSVAPSNTPTLISTSIPSHRPSSIPSIVPSDWPSTIPSNVPSDVPSNGPSNVPFNEDNDNAPTTVPNLRVVPNPLQADGVPTSSAGRRSMAAAAATCAGSMSVLLSVLL